MPFYHTGLVVKPSEVKIIKQYCKNLRLKFKPDPTGRFSCSKDESTLSQITSFEANKEMKLARNDVALQEVQIFAKSEDEMKNYLSIIKTGIALGTTVYPIGLECILESNHSSIKCLNEIDIYWKQYNHIDGIDIGFFTLNNTLNNTRYIYALEKYRFSIESEGFNPYSANPRYGQVFDNESPLYADHVNQLMAIVAAYSVIEELDCEIRASAKNPRFINNKTCEWNPKVWNEIETRLTEKGIDTSYEFQWTIRGSDTIVHKEFQYHLFGKESKYNDGEEVKDRTLHIIEAIQFASFLRSAVAAHKFNEKSSAISPYDLHNVQMISRYLIMQCIGIWDYIKKTNRIKAKK